MPTLNWMGKDKVVNHHNDVPYKVLEQKYSFDNKGKHEDSNGSENMIIHGDNLEALKSLLPKYEGRIKCIYIDPPYNTGNEKWVYNDNVNDPRIKKWLGEVVGKEGEDFSRHDKWLCMMYPRLKLLQKLLSDDGAIFISISDIECSFLKLICDEIFGYNHFIADVTVVNNFKGRSDDKYIATASEHLLIYHNGNFITNGVPLPEEYENDYKEVDKDGNRYRLQGLRKRGSNSKRSDRPNMYYPFYYDINNNVVTLEKENDDMIEIYPYLSDGSEGCWRWGKNTAIEKIEQIMVRKVHGKDRYDVFQIDYLNNGQSKRVKPKSIWIGSEFAKETGTLEIKNIFGNSTFDTPKSVAHIQYCLEQALGETDIVLDSFAGSGTTAHAVLNMNKADGGNRKFILIEMEDYADTITAERVKRVIKGYGEDKKKVEGVGGDFSYYELGEPIFKDNLLNPAVSADKIREYVYYMETKKPLENPIDMDEPYFMAIHDNTAYYFFYEKDEETVLDLESLNMNVKQKAESYVIYADSLLLDEAFLAKHNITFKKIPRDIARL